MEGPIDTKPDPINTRSGKTAIPIYASGEVFYNWEFDLERLEASELSIKTNDLGELCNISLVNLLPVCASRGDFENTGHWHLRPPQGAVHNAKIIEGHGRRSVEELIGNLDWIDEVESGPLPVQGRVLLVDSSAGEEEGRDISSYVCQVVQ